MRLQEGLGLGFALGFGFRGCLQERLSQRARDRGLQAVGVAFALDENEWLGFWVSCFRLRVSGFRFRVSGFGFRVSGFGFRVSDFGLRDPNQRGGSECVAHHLEPLLLAAIRERQTCEA